MAEMLPNLLGQSLEYKKISHSSFGGAQPRGPVTVSTTQLKLLNSRRCQGWIIKLILT